MSYARTYVVIFSFFVLQKLVGHQVRADIQNAQKATPLHVARDPVIMEVCACHTRPCHYVHVTRDPSMCMSHETLSLCACHTRPVIMEVCACHMRPCHYVHVTRDPSMCMSHETLSLCACHMRP